MNIILASSSRYRAQLLKQLNLNFYQIAPETDETPLVGEESTTYVKRVAKNKALAVAAIAPPEPSIVIASDQGCFLNNQHLKKPMTKEKAIKQLLQCSEQKVSFFTSLAMFNSQSQKWYEALDHVQVTFRKLSPKIVTHYINVEQPLDCAGAFKIEGQGISLFQKVESNDPTSLIGLPLIEVINGLTQLGHQCDLW